jgi:hypothetical protein
MSVKRAIVYRHERRETAGAPAPGYIPPRATSQPPFHQPRIRVGTPTLPPPPTRSVLDDAVEGETRETKQ